MRVPLAVFTLAATANAVAAAATPDAGASAVEDGGRAAITRSTYTASPVAE